MKVQLVEAHEAVWISVDIQFQVFHYVQALFLDLLEILGLGGVFFGVIDLDVLFLQRAVIADLVDITRMHTADPEHHVPHFAFRSDRLSDTPALPMGEVKSCYYLRMQVVDQPGVLADITRILADLSISIEAMLQHEPVEGEAHVNIIIITHMTIEKNMIAAIERIEALAVTTGSVIRIRIESLDGK